MKQVTMKIAKLDVPTRNNRTYSQNVLSEALKDIDILPITHNGYEIGCCTDINLDYPQLNMKGYLDNWVPCSKVYPVLRGQGDVEFEDGTYKVKYYEILGIDLTQMPAMESTIEINKETEDD